MVLRISSSKTHKIALITRWPRIQEDYLNTRRLPGKVIPDMSNFSGKSFIHDGCATLKSSFCIADSPSETYQKIKIYKKTCTKFRGSFNIRVREV